MKRWFAVHTKAGKERLAEGNLLAQGFETYLPRIAARRGRTGRVQPAATPMFPRYLFVRLDLDASPWRAVNSTFGVSRLVSFGERPAPLPDAVIDGLRGREGADGIISLADAVAPFKPGDAVEIAEGPLSDVSAMVCAQSGRERVVVLMTLLGRQVPVRVGPDRLRRAS